MSTIAAGTSSTLYIPIAQSLTITPGTSGKASINGRNQDGSAITPQEIYSATTIALRAGATITVEAINVDATCTDVADSLSSVSGGEVVNSITYNADGSVAAVVDASGTTSIGYDLAGKPVTITSPSGVKTISYNPNGTVASVA